jgi:hypothetical protein
MANLARDLGIRRVRIHHFVIAITGGLMMGE